MKTLLLTTALLITATSASAFTCKNTVAMVDGEWSYTSSQCGTQAPASAEVLEMITYTANNPPKDLEEEVVEDVTVDELTKLDKLVLRKLNLTKRIHKNKAQLKDLIKEICPTCSNKKLNKITTYANRALSAVAEGKTNKAQKLSNKTWKTLGPVFYTLPQENKGKRIADRLINIHADRDAVQDKIQALSN